MKQVAVALPEKKRAVALPTLAEIAAKAKQGIAVATKCGPCGFASGVPSPRCPRCASTEIEVREEAAAGRLVSYSLVYVAGDAFSMYKPYAYSLVELDSGARVSGWVLAEEIDDLAIGNRVRAVAHEGQALLFTMKEAG
jgi:hypothetical protein